MVSDLLIGTLVGASSAIGGAFVAQRYQHVLDVRVSHHADLTSTILNPWLGEIRRLQQFTGLYGMSHYSHPKQDEGYDFRKGRLGNESALDTAHPLWKKSHDHWPRIAAAWHEANKEFEKVDSQVESLLKSVEAKLGDPPAGIEYEFHNRREPGFGRRLTACAAWDAYWQWTNLDQWEEMSPQFLEKRKLTSGSDPPESYRRETSARLKSFFDDPGTIERLIKAHKGARAVEPKLAVVQSDLLHAIHDRNLARRCSFCPRFWGAARAAKRVYPEGES